MKIPTAVPALPDAKRILSNGMFPENMPPVFDAEGIGSHYAGTGSQYLVTKGVVGKHSIINGSKRGNQRRLFAVPHPAFLHDQALFVERHWGDIQPLMARSPGSASVPSFEVSGARSVKTTAHSELPLIRLRKFSRYKYCLVADISRFYYSIYTHSIPWAFHGKDISKQDRAHTSSTVFANRLDFVLRQSQDGQTVGIAVGPDISRVVSEVLLSAVDEALLKRVPNIAERYVRHVDDYWIASDSQEQAERDLEALRGALREFELDVNEAKTRIVPVYKLMGETWPREISDQIGRTLKQNPFEQKSSEDTMSTLGSILERLSEGGDEGIVKHAIRRIDEGRLWGENWRQLEYFLAQAAVQSGHSFDYVARVVAWRHRLGETIDKKLWIQIAKKTVAGGVALGRDSEVIWALWLLKELAVVIPKSMAEAITEKSSPWACVLLAHMAANGLVAQPWPLVDMWQRIDGDAYLGRDWPIALELNFLGVKMPSSVKAISSSDVSGLHGGKVSAVNWVAAPKVFVGPTGTAVSKPDKAIERIGSDYDDDVDDGFDVDFDLDL